MSLFAREVKSSFRRNM